MILPNDIPEQWRPLLENRVEDTVFAELSKFIEEERSKYRVFPPEEHVWRIFEKVSPEHVRVVIVGQDPYHEYGQANGLAFSVPEGEKIPPSLRNIYKELSRDLGVDCAKLNGDLNRWIDSGVLLMNSVLTVREHKANSHKNRGWEIITDQILKIISEKSSHVVFILWGNYAISKRSLIDENRHYIITSAHPSPLSASRGFFNSCPFSRCNQWLTQNSLKAIDWV